MEFVQGVSLLRGLRRESDCTIWGLVLYCNKSPLMMSRSLLWHKANCLRRRQYFASSTLTLSSPMSLSCKLRRALVMAPCRQVLLRESMRSWECFTA